MTAHEDQTEVFVTERGFAGVLFQDDSGLRCSLQESSAVEPHVWLGVAETRVRQLVPQRGWQDVPIPRGSQAATRMHLTIDMARQLIAELQYFVDNGRVYVAEDCMVLEQ